MKIYSWNSSSDITMISHILKKGDVVAGSSDTVLGLLALATKEGRNKLDCIKGRSEKPYLILVSDYQAALAYSETLTRPDVKGIAHTYWPGPLTMVVKAREALPDYLQSKDGGIAIRVPQHEGLQKLLKITGSLFSTSANLSGQPVPLMLNEIDEHVAHSVAAMVEGSSEHTQPSTIINCMIAPISLIREGAIMFSTLIKT